MDKRKVLVVDDDIRISCILQEFLDEKDFNVKCVHSGINAIELLIVEEFDLVLCDYVMPVVTGYDIAIFLNSLDKKPKIGLITGWSDLIKTKYKQEMDLDFIINKPFDFLELESLINGLFDVT